MAYNGNKEVKNMDKYVAQRVRDLAYKRNQLIDKLQKEYEEYRKYQEIKNKKAYSLWGYFWRIALLIVTLFYLIKYPFYLALYILAFFLFIASIVFLIMMIAKTITYNNEMKDLKNKSSLFKAYSVNLEKEINDCTKELESYDIISPYYYCVADAILNYIVIGRADNVKDAINLFEYEQRQDAQFRMQMQQLQKINSNLQRNGLINAAGFATLGIINAVGFSSISNSLRK